MNAKKKNRLKAVLKIDSRCFKYIKFGLPLIKGNP